MFERALRSVVNIHTSYTDHISLLLREECSVRGVKTVKSLNIMNLCNLRSLCIVTDIRDNFSMDLCRNLFHKLHTDNTGHTLY